MSIKEITNRRDFSIQIDTDDDEINFVVDDKPADPNGFENATWEQREACQRGSSLLNTILRQILVRRKRSAPDKLEEEVPDLPIFALRKPEQSFQSRLWPVASSCNDHDSVMTSICV